MKKFLFLLIFLNGCEVYIGNPQKINNNKYRFEIMSPGTNLRQQNYLGGSCVHASMITILNWQHKEKEAEYWRTNFSGACSKATLIRNANSLGLDIAYVENGDPNFLEWCSRTRRGAVIFYYENHCITFCGYTNNYAILIDNNSIHEVDKIPKSKFLSDWKAYGGFALTPVYAPTPPIPKKP